jgi:hypothetical protein
MSIKSRIIRGILRWLWVRYPFQFKDIVIPDGYHLSRNPPKTGPGSRRKKWDEFIGEKVAE